jgi:hypothetical protein
MIKIKWTDIVNKHVPTNIEDESILLRLSDLQVALEEKLEATDAVDKWVQDTKKRNAETLESEASAIQGSAERPAKRLRSVHNIYH